MFLYFFCPVCRFLCSFLRHSYNTLLLVVSFRVWWTAWLKTLCGRLWRRLPIPYTRDHNRILIDELFHQLLPGTLSRYIRALVDICTRVSSSAQHFPFVCQLPQGDWLEGGWAFVSDVDNWQLCRAERKIWFAGSGRLFLLSVPIPRVQWLSVSIVVCMACYLECCLVIAEPVSGVTSWSMRQLWTTGKKQRSAFYFGDCL